MAYKLLVLAVVVWHGRIRSAFMEMTGKLVLNVHPGTAVRFQALANRVLSCRRTVSWLTSYLASAREIE